MCEVVERFKKEGYERAKQEDKQEYIKIAAKLRDEGIPEEKIRKILGNYYDDLLPPSACV